VETDHFKRDFNCSLKYVLVRTLSKYSLVFFGILFLSNFVMAQEEEPLDDLGNVSDAFQENFFEALKQKGIENYELALEALTRAERAATNKENVAVVNFERGKNLTLLKRYEEAESNFKEVIASQGNRLDVLEALYDLYYLEQDFKSAIPLVQTLIEYDEDYKEDLANLYSRTNQFDKALTVLDELDALWGESDYRDALRSQIYRKTGNTDGAIENLQGKIDQNPKNEQDYLNLIFLYSEQGDQQKAFDAAKQLLANQPNSTLVHLALYKFYLDDGNTQEALKSMKIVFSSSEVEEENKYKVLADFIQFVNTHPQHENKLKDVVASFSEVGDGKVYEQLGTYYLQKGEKETALAFFEQGIAKDLDNFSLLKNTLLIQIEQGKYSEAANLSESGLEIFPAQALLYLINGVANINLQSADTAIESLETGVDYLLDDLQMEKDFYEQLSVAYGLKGNTAKADMYAKRAAEIKLSN
jgi:tetratricopeptide (TPR) repeat protein